MKPPLQALQVLKHNHFQSRLTQLCRFANLFRGCNTAEQVKGGLKESHLYSFKAESPQTRHDCTGSHGGHRGAYSYGRKADALQAIVEGIGEGQAGKGLGPVGMLFSPLPNKRSNADMS